MLKLKPRDFKLGDVIQLGNGGAYMTATVTQIRESTLTVQRPFLHTGDFEYTGGVLWYVGIEAVHLFRDSEHEYLVFQRGSLSD